MPLTGSVADVMKKDWFVYRLFKGETLLYVGMTGELNRRLPISHERPLLNRTLVAGNERKPYTRREVVTVEKVPEPWTADPWTEDQLKTIRAWWEHQDAAERIDAIVDGATL